MGLFQELGGILDTSSFNKHLFIMYLLYLLIISIYYALCAILKTELWRKLKMSYGL